jgi:hypothetical protein
MKAFILISLFLTSTAFAGIDCKPARATVYLYKVQDNLRDLPTCRLPKCFEKKLAKIERNYCKALSVCPILNEKLKLDDPCLDDVTLKPEVKEQIKDKSEEYFKIMVDALLDYVKDLKNKFGDKDEEVIIEEDA